MANREGKDLQSGGADFSIKSTAPYIAHAPFINAQISRIRDNFKNYLAEITGTILRINQSVKPW